MGWRIGGGSPGMPVRSGLDRLGWAEKKLILANLVVVGTKVPGIYYCEVPAAAAARHAAPSNQNRDAFLNILFIILYCSFEK